MKVYRDIMVTRLRPQAARLRDRGHVGEPTSIPSPESWRALGNQQSIKDPHLYQPV
jgi:hypothetical protein